MMRIMTKSRFSKVSYLYFYLMISVTADSKKKLINPFTKFKQNEFTSHSNQDEDKQVWGGSKTVKRLVNQTPLQTKSKYT